MIVGRVFPSARTTASAIESTAKGATGPEEAVETTNGAVDDTGNSSERSPADKLLLVERGGIGIMYNQNKNQRRARERRTNATRQRAGKPRSMTGKILLGCCGCGMFTSTGNRYTGPAKKPRYREHRSVLAVTSERRASRDEPDEPQPGGGDGTEWQKIPRSTNEELLI